MNTTFHWIKSHSVLCGRTSNILLSLTSKYISCSVCISLSKASTSTSVNIHRYTVIEKLSIAKLVRFITHKYPFPSQLPLCIFFWGGIHKYNKKQKLILTSYSLLLSKLSVSSCISHHMISIIMVGVNE